MRRAKKNDDMTPQVRVLVSTAALHACDVSVFCGSSHAMRGRMQVGSGGKRIRSKGHIRGSLSKENSVLETAGFWGEGGGSLALGRGAFCRSVDGDARS